jgi:LPS-assembly protein
MTTAYFFRNRSVLTYNLLRIKQLLFVIIILSAASAYGKGIKDSYTLEAERVEFDSKQNILTASGKVELFRKDNLLKADKVLYHKADNKAYAYGNVILIRPNGEEFYADSLELSNDFKEILAIELKARLRDNNVFTARRAHSYQEKMSFDKATYSPCIVCKGGKPQWQIRSSKIEYVKKKDTSFTNNFFDIYGVTSFYLPYFKVAAHDAEPRSGFLFPNYYKYRAILGAGVSVPYYLRINDSNDFLYTPIFTTKGKILHMGKYRFMLQKEHQNQITFDYIRSKQRTNPAPPQDRYYIKSNIDHTFSPQLLLTSEIAKVSDKSYLKNYRDQNINYLRSFVNLNHLTDTSQLNGASYHFQELRTENKRHNTDITIAPRLKYDKTLVHEKERFYIKTEALNMMQAHNGNISKMNVKLDWDRNYGFHNHKIETTKTVYLDVYKFSNLKPELLSSYKKDYTFSRAIPEVSAAWKYPVMVANSWQMTYLEPIVKAIVSQADVHNRNIFNADSQEIELNDSNVFNNNRYPGSDRLEEGFRMSYGLIGAGQVMSYQYPSYNFIIGQSYRAQKGGDYSVNSGLKDRRFSDYVGRVSLKTSYITDLHYLFQVDQRNYVFRKNEIGSVFNFDFKNKTLERLVLDAKLSSYNYKVDESGIRQSVSMTGTIYFFEEWYARAAVIQNLYRKSTKPIETAYALGYNGQCTTIVLSVINSNTRDETRGIKRGGYAYNFEVHLKNIN